MCQELILNARSRSQMVLAIAALLGLMLVPAAPAAAQELLIDESGAADAVDATARSDRDTSQRFEVSLVGTLQSGGASDPSRYGTVTVTIQSEMGWSSASKTYEIGPCDNADDSFKQQLRAFVNGHSGRKVFLKGHLHGDSRSRDYMHVEYASGTSSFVDQMNILRLTGQLIDQRWGFPGVERTAFGVDATHNGFGDPIRFNLSLPSDPSRIGKITVVHAPVEAWFVTIPQLVIVASQYQIH